MNCPVMGWRKPRKRGYLSLSSLNLSFIKFDNNVVVVVGGWAAGKTIGCLQGKKVSGILLISRILFESFSSKIPGKKVALVKVSLLRVSRFS